MIITPKQTAQNALKRFDTRLFYFINIDITFLAARHEIISQPKLIRDLFAYVRGL
jgi:hypothetical protein